VSSTSLGGKEFNSAVNQNHNSGSVTIIACVCACTENDADAVMVSMTPNSQPWIRIPSTMIESGELLHDRGVTPHGHSWARLSLRKPSNDEAVLLTDLLRQSAYQSGAGSSPVVSLAEGTLPLRILPLADGSLPLVFTSKSQPSVIVVPAFQHVGNPIVVINMPAFQHVGNG